MKIFAGSAKNAGFSCNANSAFNGSTPNVRHQRYLHTQFRRAPSRAANVHQKTMKRTTDSPNEKEERGEKPPHTQNKKVRRVAMVLAQYARNTIWYAKMGRCGNISHVGSHKHQQKTATE